MRVVIFERRRPAPGSQRDILSGPYAGCPQCAGGVSPRLSEALAELDIGIPDDVLSVYRGSLPVGHGPDHASFDALLMDTAVGHGAELIGSRVNRAFYDHDQRPVLCYSAAGEEEALTADFAAFAGGVNERPSARANSPTSIALLRMLQPAYEPPRLRKALIVELAAPADCFELAEGTLH